MGRKVSKSRLNKKYQSGYINVTQGPRSLILDRDEAKDRDRIFANKERIRTTVGYGSNTVPKVNNPYTEVKWVEYDKSLSDQENLKRGCRRIIKTIKVHGRWEEQTLWSGAFVPVDRAIPDTIGVGSVLAGASSSAVDYTKSNLPKTKNEDRRLELKKLEELSQSDRLTIIREYNWQVLYENRNHKLKLGVLGNKYCFVKETKEYVLRSFIYTGRERAMLAYYGKIDWVEKFSPADIPT